MKGVHILNFNSLYFSNIQKQFIFSSLVLINYEVDSWVLISIVQKKDIVFKFCH